VAFDDPLEVTVAGLLSASRSRRTGASMVRADQTYWTSGFSLSGADDRRYFQHTCHQAESSISAIRSAVWPSHFSGAGQVKLSSVITLRYAAKILSGSVPTI